MTSLFLSAALVLIAASASAQSLSYGRSDYATYQDPLMMLNGHAVPTSPLKAGLKELKITPAYITSYSHNATGGGQSLEQSAGKSFSDNVASGFGLSAAWLQGISEHWGWTVSATFSRMSGKTFAFGDHAANGSLVKRHDANEIGTAFQGAAMVIYDPFEGEGFRLPLFAGYGFLHQRQSAKYRARSTTLAGSPEISYTSEFTAFIPGAVFGASPQFNTGPLRWTPFIAIQLKHNNPAFDNIVKNETTGAELSRLESNNGDPFLGTLGLGVRYKPWDLDFKYIPNITGMTEEGLGASVYSISKTFKFGE